MAKIEVPIVSEDFFGDKQQTAIITGRNQTIEMKLEDPDRTIKIFSTDLERALDFFRGL